MIIKILKQIDKGTFIFCLLIFFVLLPLWPVNHGVIVDLQFLGLAAFNFLALFFCRIRVLKTDFFWFIFILSCFCSFFFATDMSKCFNPFFSWLMLTVWMIIWRDIGSVEKYKNVFHRFSLFSFIVITIYISLNSIRHGSYTYVWNDIFTKNSNYIGSLQTFFFASIFFSHGVLNNWIIKTAGILILGAVIFVTTTKGALFACSFSFLLFYLLYKFRINIIWLILIGVISVLLLLYMLDLESLFQVRYYQAVASLKMFLDYYAVGLGNWHLHAYDYDFSNVEIFSNGFHHIRFRNHNLFSSILSETGLIGLISFVCGLFSPLYYMSKLKTCYSYIAPFVVSIFLYFSLSNFYGTISMNSTHFSGLELLTFAYLGILDSYSLKYSKCFEINTLKQFFVGICCCALLWFSYFSLKKHMFFKAMQIPQSQERISQLIGLREKYLFSGVHFNKNLDYQIACDQIELNDTLGAIKSFKKSLDFTPSHIPSLFELGKNLYLQNDRDVGVYYLRKVHALQDNVIQTNFLLAEIYAKEANIDSSEYFLSFVSNSPYVPRYKKIKEQISRIGE